MNVLQALQARLAGSGVPNAGQEAKWLLERAGCPAVRAMAGGELTAAEAAALESLVRRREAGEPLQYILGEGAFWGRDFRVGPGVLIPRQDTELLVETALRLIPRGEAFTFLDWGTGSGCIAATLLLEFPNARALGADKSGEALRYAEKNLARYGLEGRARLLRSGTPEDIDASGLGLVISNPPYIPAGEIPHLMREVRDHEPRLALDGGADGLDCYRALLRAAPRWLGPEGLLIVEATDPEGVRALPCEGLSFLEEARGGISCLAWRKQAFHPRPPG